MERVVLMNRIKRSLTALVFSAVMFFAVPFPVYAANPDNEIELSVAIPEQHTVAMKTAGNGSVEVVDGNQDGSTAKVERHTSQSYKITSNEGYEIDKVIYNGEDVTAQVKDGIFTAPEISGDAVLEVMLREIPAVTVTTEPEVKNESTQSMKGSDSGKTVAGSGSSPKTGDSGVMNWLILLAAAVWIGMWSASKRRQKK